MVGKGRLIALSLPFLLVTFLLSLPFPAVCLATQRLIWYFECLLLFRTSESGHELVILGNPLLCRLGAEEKDSILEGGD